MALTVHDQGDEVTLRADFTNLAEEPAVPTDLDGWIRKPDGTVVALPAFVQDGTTPSLWTTTYTVDQPGRWFWRVEFVGSALSHDEEHGFLVRTRLVGQVTP